MRRSALVLLLFFSSATSSIISQVVESATSRQLTINVGGMVSGFDPHDVDQPFYFTQSSKLIGIGTYVDVHLTHWIQVEAEGRWMRWNGYAGTHQDNYLIGPRVPIYQLGRGTQIYGKALIGAGKMTFPNKYGYGTFTDLAFGGAVDHKLSRKLSVKADFEYQYWPKWLTGHSLSPYGLSLGVGYRVF